MKLLIFSLCAGPGCRAAGRPGRAAGRGTQVRRGAAGHERGAVRLGKKRAPGDISGGAYVMKKVALRPCLAEAVFEVHSHCHRLNQSSIADHLV